MNDKKDDIVESLVKAGALIGGMWLTLEIIKAFSEKVYKCPICETEVKLGMPICPKCKTKMEWR